MLFMLAARWADDIRTKPQFHRSSWHFINLPFKPAGQPEHVFIKQEGIPNILTALAHNQNAVEKDPDPVNKTIALAWLFHLVGDVHQPLHTAQLFTVDYTEGDRGGNEICRREKQENQPINLHKFWDDRLIKSPNFTSIRNLAISLRNQPEFSRDNLTELAITDFTAWGNESFALGVTTAYRNGTVGMPKGHNEECSELQSAPVLPIGYIPTAEPVADRRMILSGYRLADLLKRVTQNFLRENRNKQTIQSQG